MIKYLTFTQTIFFCVSVIGIVLPSSAVSPAISTNPTPKSIVYQNRNLTPGAVVTAGQIEICTPNYLIHHPRLVSASLKRDVCKSYGLGAYCLGKTVKIIYLIPVGLGGMSSRKNLFPLPIDQAMIKNRLDDRLRKAVCAGKLSLGVARACITNDWFACAQCWDPAICPMGR